MKLVMKDVTSARVVDGRLYVALGSNERSCRIATLGNNGSTKNVASPLWSPCNLLLGFRDNLLVSAGNTLYIASNDGAKPVLRARHGNWFWHAVEACGRVFVQEYGESPTSIYVSEDLESFRLLVTNKDVDPLSRHFHSIAFDKKRNILIAMLGDGNIVRAVTSTDCGYSWKPLYKGPWQFVPVLVEENRWVFGFDSGIARGGVAIYDVAKDEWRFVFLKADGYRYAQFTFITRFSNYYIGCLGYPTAVLVSKDLHYWYPLYIDPTSTKYIHFVNAVVWRDKVVAVTGKELLMFDSRDVEEAFRRKPFLTPYKAYFDRVRGVLYILKRLPWMLRF
jgi:hypothetical protein